MTDTKQDICKADTIGVIGMNDLISRQAAIDAMCELMRHWFGGNPKDEIREIKRELEKLPSAQPEIIYCKNCEYGEQDEVGRWFCRSLGCQIGNEDGSGYCADAERRTDE